MSEDRLHKVAEEQALHIAALKEKLDKIDALSKDQVYADPIKKLQEEMYQQLLVLREGLYQTLDASCGLASGAHVAAVAATTVAASDEASALEIKKLKDENTKLNYRIKILCQTLDEVSQKK